MCHYAFYTTGLKEQIVEKLEEFIQDQEIDGNWAVEDGKQLAVVHYESPSYNPQDDEDLAHALSDLIQKEALIRVCNERLNERMDLSLLERREVTENFLKNNYLSRQEGYSYMTYYLLYLPIYHEIKEKHTLNVEGWLQFRLAQYKTIIRDVLDQFTEDYMTKKDVVSFIRLMRESTFLAVPLEEEIHVLYTPDGKVQIYNNLQKNVTAYYIKKYCQELLIDSSLTREDLLLHVLITVCPKKVVVHNKEYMSTKQFLNTLELVFGNHITYCSGCNFCRQQAHTT